MTSNRFIQGILAVLALHYCGVSSARYLQSDPVGLIAGVNTYAYADGNPMIWVDPMGLDACYVHFPNMPIEYATGRTSTNLGGHAGVLGYDNAGMTRYYEYGRYDPSSSGVIGVPLPSDAGNVRRLGVPNLMMDRYGNPTLESMEALRSALSKKAGKGTEAELDCDKDADEKKVYEYVERIANDAKRDHYNWVPLNPNHCRTFARGAVGAGR